MSTSLKITYDLKPPSETLEKNDLSTSKSHEFVVPASTESGQREYYVALQAAITEAREQVGKELTAWRDAVGKAELKKEAKGAVRSEEEESDEVEEEGSDS